MVTQEQLDMAMAELAEARTRANNAKVALYGAIATDAQADYELAPEHAAQHHRHFAHQLRDLEETLRIAGHAVSAAEDKVRTLEANTSRWRP
jgi:predicted  nucleic acid-binding Zn-ribbon protein